MDIQQFNGQEWQRPNNFDFENDWRMIEHFLQGLCKLSGVVRYSMITGCELHAMLLESVYLQLVAIKDAAHEYADFFHDLAQKDIQNAKEHHNRNLIGAD